MSEIKIPQTSPSTLSKTTTPENSQVSKDAKPSYRLDSLEEISQTKDQGLAAGKSSNMPQLPQPDVYPDSMLAYFKAISGSRLAFKLQLAASDRMDLEQLSKKTKSAVKQAMTYSQVLQEREKLIEKIKSNAKEAAEEIKKLLDSMDTDRQKLQELIDKLNGGNELEKKQYQELSKAYDRYVEKLKDIGAIDNGDGTFTVPEEAMDEYNDIAQEYKQAVGKFNSYWKGRQAEINEYNQAAEAYNQKAALNDRAVKELIEKYGVDISFPSQPRAPHRDLAGSPDKVKGPPQIGKAPAEISVPPLSSYIRSIAEFGPDRLDSLPLPIPPDGKAVEQTIYASLYQEHVKPLDDQLALIAIYWQFNHLNETSFAKAITEPILNSKPLAQRILPESAGGSPQKKAVALPAESLSSLGTIGIDSKELAGVLGRTLLKQALDRMNLNLSKEISGKKEEAVKEDIADRLLLFSVGLLGNQSLYALFPSVSPISQPLSTLPADSPVFALLFAVSLANRIQEDSGLGVNIEALQTYIQDIPELAALSEEDVKQLAAILDLGQLLVAAKLIETTLGMPNLLTQMFIQLFTTDPEKLLIEEGKDQQVSKESLAAGIEKKFIEEGFSDESAKFLSDVGLEIFEQGVLTPSAPSVPSSDAIQVPLLVNSVKAALVLSNISLDEADSLAKEAVDHTLAQTPFPSPKQLRSVLTTQLQDLGLRDKAAEIAQQAIVIPPKMNVPLTHPLPEYKAASAAPSALSTASPPKAVEQRKTNEITQQPSLKATSPAPIALMTPSLLAPLLEKRVLELLTPSLGSETAKSISAEVVQTFLGPPTREKREQAEINLPSSLINAVRNQLGTLKLKENTKASEAATETFKDTIKTMESFSAFYQKLMNPAYSLIFSGIIYEERGRKKAVDIMI